MEKFVLGSLARGESTNLNKTFLCFQGFPGTLQETHTSLYTHWKLSRENMFHFLCTWRQHLRPSRILLNGDKEIQSFAICQLQCLKLAGGCGAWCQGIASQLHPAERMLCAAPVLLKPSHFRFILIMSPHWYPIRRVAILSGTLIKTRKGVCTLIDGFLCDAVTFSSWGLVKNFLNFFFKHIHTISGKTKCGCLSPEDQMRKNTSLAELYWFMEPWKMGLWTN